MKLPERPIRRARHIPFTWLDGWVLVGFAGWAVGWALQNDQGYLGSMPYFATGRLPKDLPAWVEDLELPVKRIESDFAAFLGVMSLGIALASFRRRASWCLVGLPGPGIAATAVGAPVLVARQIWIHALFCYHVCALHGVRTQAALSFAYLDVSGNRVPKASFWLLLDLFETANGRAGVHLGDLGVLGPGTGLEGPRRLARLAGPVARLLLAHAGRFSRLGHRDLGLSP